MNNLIFGAVVKVIAGFYMGCPGVVQEPAERGWYVVDVTCADFEGTTYYVMITVEDTTLRPIYGPWERKQ